MTEADKYIRRLDKGGEDWSNDNRMLSDALQDFADEQVREGRASKLFKVL